MFSILLLYSNLFCRHLLEDIHSKTFWKSLSETFKKLIVSTLHERIVPVPLLLLPEYSLVIGL